MIKVLKNKYAKLFLIIFILSAIIFVIFYEIQKRVKPFDIKRVALIDVIGNNYVFRGDNPFTIKSGKASFAYFELTDAFNKKLQEKGYKPLDDYYLVDLSMLDMDQYYISEKEESFFEHHPQYGEIIDVSTISPTLFLEQLSNSKTFNRYVSFAYNVWIDDVLDEIHSKILKHGEKPVVLYIHCNSGRDRTGMMVASYRMLFKNMTLEETKKFDILEVGRSSVPSYGKETQSYCLYLKRKYRKPNDYCQTSHLQ